MFGVIRIDFSSLQQTGSADARGGYIAALGMGSVSALLAGACVAPVVIAVLLLAAHFYESQPTLALLLPFLLGLGWRCLGLLQEQGSLFYQNQGSGWSA